MFNKAVNAYRLTLMHAPVCYKTNNIYNNIVNNCPAVLSGVSHCYKTQKLYEKFVSKKAFHK